MKMFEFKGINFESIKLSVGSLVGVGKIFHKEEHQDNRKIQLEQTSQTYIANQLNLSLEGLTPEQQTDLIQSALGKKEQNDSEVLEPPKAQTTEPLPQPTEESGTEKFLKQRLEDYKSNPELLLDRGALLSVYTDREKIGFSEEELVFLVQSSIKNEFPIWYWSFYQRENFESVSPMFKNAYAHESLKIRCGVIEALTSFSDTSDDIIELCESERNPKVLGYAASAFARKKDYPRLQRVVANALTRRIVPELTEEGRGLLNKISIDLGAAERRFLCEKIENGWTEEKILSLGILSTSAEESDLETLEKFVGTSLFIRAEELVLLCIAKIGKTTKADKIEKELLETNRIETFYAALDVLVKINYEPLFDQLLEWLGKAERISGRFWGEVDDSKIKDNIQDSLLELLNEKNYNKFVEYILDNYDADYRGNIWSWRHFWVLRMACKKSGLRDFIKKEKRLVDFEKWADVKAELIQVEEVAKESPDQLFEAAKVQTYNNKLFILRKLYTLITPEKAFEMADQFIEDLRIDLKQRLKKVSEEDHPEDVKKIAANDLDKFLGENHFFYRLQRKKKRGRRAEDEGEKDVAFEQLSEDIDKFNYIEKEYLTHIFKSDDKVIQKKLLVSIGRPHECIYESLQTSTGEVGALERALNQVIVSDPNKLLKLKAIDAALRIGVCERAELHLKTLEILVNSRTIAKAPRGEDYDTWFTGELTYGWAVNTLSKFGDVIDFPLIKEAENREKVISRSYRHYGSYQDISVFGELLDLTEILEDPEDKGNTFSTLEDLDYRWSKKILGIED